MKRRLTALICAMVLSLSLLNVQAINAGDVYFTSVNDRLLPLSMDTMPTWVSGRLYVPTSVFDTTVTGANLGLYCNQSKTSNTVTLYSLRQMLVFDLSRGIAYDQHSGQSLDVRAINRNGRIYLPVETVCNFFGLEDTYNYTQYGYLVRIKSEAAWLNDTDFIDAAGTQLSSQLDAFLRSQTSPDAPPNPPTAPATPDPPQATDPSVPSEPQSFTPVCLAFRCETGEGLEQTLTLLSRENVHGIFFFTPQTLTQQDNLVRRVVGSGHSIGLLAEGSSADESRLLLTQANETLRHVARAAATAALVPDDQRAALAEEGWVCWRETVSGLPREKERASTFAQRVIRAVGTRSRTVYLTLDDSQHTASLLPTLLQQLKQGEYTITLPLETRL